MKTKGINTSEQIWAIERGEKCEQSQNELYLKSMMISCYAYGSMEKGSYDFEEYIKPYIDKLGKKVFEEVYKEQYEFLQKCSIKRGVYTDSEDCVYNSVIYPE